MDASGMDFYINFHIFHFEKLVQYFELKRVGGAPKGPPLAPLVIICFCSYMSALHVYNF